MAPGGRPTPRSGSAHRVARAGMPAAWGRTGPRNAEGGGPRSRSRRACPDEDAQVLSAILDEDRQTDVRLSAIADETVNPAAL